jgi:CRP-like cAMP-binding protein
MQRDVSVQNGAVFEAGSSLFHAIEADEFERLRPLLESVVLPQGTLLATAGEPVDELWFPHGAIVSAVVRLNDGEAVEAGLIGAEGVIGIEAFWGLPRSLLTTVVQVPGRVDRVRADVLRAQLDAFPSLGRAVFHFGGALLASIAQIAACNATHTLRQRMARWLLMAHDRAGRNRFRLTHEFIATMINVRRAGVSQFASEMRAAGAIAYTRGEIEVVDRSVLERESCECYAVIRHLMLDPVADMVR